MGDPVINYDTPWVEICEAARSAPWAVEHTDRASHLNRLPLTETEFSQLAGIPVVLVHKDELPPHPKNYRQINPLGTQYAEMMALRAGAIAQQFAAHKLPLPELASSDVALAVAEHTGFTTYTNYVALEAPGAPPLRLGSHHNHITSALPHRLAGDIIPTCAILLTDSEHLTQPKVIACAERQLWLPGDDFKVMSEAHELTHLLQLRNHKEIKPLLAQTLAERDAEHNGLTLYQTVFGGSAAHAAARIISHMSTQFELTPIYGFSPGLSLAQLDHGNPNTTALRLFALYTHVGEKPPRWLALEATGHLRAQNLSPNIVQMFGDELAEIALFAKAYTLNRGVTGMLQDTLRGLKQMAAREFDLIPENIRPLASQLADAAAFTNPELMGFDPVKPRLSYHLLPKRNAATPA